MDQESEHLSGYEFDVLLHDSSTSAVYRGRRSSDGSVVVIKRTQGDSVSAHQLTRYRNEYELLRSFQYEGVVQAYDLIRDHGRLALILEEFPGCSLRQWLTGAGSELPERLDIAIQISEHIGKVHDAGVIHKDINSHNVLYDAQSKRCKLIDFGIATRLRSEESRFQFPAALEGSGSRRGHRPREGGHGRVLAAQAARPRGGRPVAPCGRPPRCGGRPSSYPMNQLPRASARASHANGARRRRGARESVSGSPRGEAPPDKIRLRTS
jgi:serine/threonine protein kinase